MKNAILILKTCSIKYGKNFALLGSFIFGSNAIAATYYVDAKSGNDSWSGTSTSVSSPNGPWQSIARVNAVKFQPGDQVLFGCGQRWSDSLKPTTNGTATAKVYFGSYPKACTDKPKISGFKSIPNQNWQPYQGNIWKTTFPQNLIINSNLSTSASNWSRWPSDASQLFNATCPLSVAGCMNFIASPTTNSSVAVSNTFPLVGGQKYVVTVSFYAKSEMSGYIVVRENGNTYRSLGLSQKIIGNDKWQNLSFEFTATHTLGNARLDIDVPKGKQIYVRQVRLQQSGVQSKPNMLVFNGDPVTIAHHPNAGHDAANPESVYFLTTSPSPSFTDGQGRKVSSQINTPDLKIPSGGSINSGTKLKLRYLEYEVNDYTVSGVNTSSISFTPNTLYPASKAGAGFYFYDAFWMLDSAGEWFFDDETQSLYLWTPTGEHPGNKVSISALGTAINLTSRSNLTVENIEIDGASIGVNAASSTGITLQSMNIHNIDKNAIFARNSVSPTIANNRFNRISASGDSGVDAYYSSDAIIEKNEITEAGVFVKSGKRISLPMTKGFGILGGSNSNISNNSLTDVGGTGVLGFNDADIDSNTIERACSNINDCAAIYLPTDALRSKIRNNLVLDVIGDMVGNPGPFRLANGIYLDDGVSGISVTGNTVKGAASSIHLHNSGKNIISDNIFYGAENRLIWQQEDTISNGGITGNVINNNQMFPSSGIVAIHNQSLSGDSSRFATYNKNIYSAIHSPYIAREYDPLGLSDAYTLEEWQVAESKAGTPRNNDLDSEIPAPLTSFAPGLVGNNFLANTDFSAGINGWSS